MQRLTVAVGTCHFLLLWIGIVNVGDTALTEEHTILLGRNDPRGTVELVGFDDQRLRYERLDDVGRDWRNRFLLRE